MIYCITGGAGFIGSHLSEELLKDENNTIIVFDNYSTGLKENLPDNKNIIIHTIDVTDYENMIRLLDTYSFDYVIHLAAIASVQDSVLDPVKTHHVNFDATLFLLEYFKHKKIRKFIFASSAAVYGDDPELPCSENSAVSPQTPYGIDKYASERYVISFNKLYHMPTVAFRFFNIYGPRQNPLSPYSGVISIFTDRIFKKNTGITIFGDGEQSRDFVYVKDLVKIIISAMKNDSFTGNVFNVGTGSQITLNTLVKVLYSIKGESQKVTYEAPRAGDIKYSVADNKKLLATEWNDGFTAVEVGLKKLIEHL